MWWSRLAVLVDSFEWLNQWIECVATLFYSIRCIRICWSKSMEIPLFSSFFLCLFACWSFCIQFLLFGRFDQYILWMRGMCMRNNNTKFVFLLMSNAYNGRIKCTMPSHNSHNILIFAMVMNLMEQEFSAFKWIQPKPTTKMPISSDGLCAHIMRFFLPPAAHK